MDAIDGLKDPEIAAMALIAREFLLSQRWVAKVLSGSVGYAVPGVIGVFHFIVEPAEPDVPGALWVVAGDVPLAYLPGDELPTWEDALDSYVWEMERWVEAVRQGESTDELIPTGVAPTVEHADLLAPRLEFIRQEILVDSDSEDSDT